MGEEVKPELYFKSSLKSFSMEEIHLIWNVYFAIFPYIQFKIS